MGRHRLVFVLAFVAASCALAILLVRTSSEADGDATVSAQEPDGSVPVAVDEGALHPAGAELAPGVEVQEGSARVGPTFPVPDLSDMSGAESSLGWQAALVVDGDPFRVWERYVVELGLDDRAGPRAACVVTATPSATPDGSPDGTVDAGAQEWRSRFVTEAPLDGEDILDCHVRTGGTTMSLSVGAERAPCLGGPGAPGDCAPRAVSHLYLEVLAEAPRPDHHELGADQLRYDRTPGATEREREPAPAPTGPLVPLRLEGRPESRLPGPGERFDDSLDPFLGGSAAALVPASGRSLVAPSMPIACNSGLVAVVEVPEAPDAAVGLFDDAEDSDDPIPTVLTGTDPEGRAWAAGRIGTAGGYYLDITALRTSDGATTVLLTECGD